MHPRQAEEALELLRSLDSKGLGTWRLPGPLAPKVVYETHLRRDAREVVDEIPLVEPDIHTDIANRTLRTKLIEAVDLAGKLEFEFRELLEFVDPAEQIWKSILRRGEPSPEMRLRPEGAAVAYRKIQQLQGQLAEVMPK